jgi:subtilisin family serine protease
MRRLSSTTLAPATGRGIRIAVVDSGVHADHPHIQGVSGGIGIDAAGVVYDDYLDRVGHGTAVTAVIREKAPGAEVFAIKIFDRELTTTGNALAAALTWAIEHGVHLVNLSLGTATPAHEAPLRNLIGAAARANVQVVSASPDGTHRWLPGALDGVISVEGDSTMPRDECELEEWTDAVKRIRASIYPRPIPGVPVERNVRGVSFAVANATGLLALLLESSLSPSR